MKKTYYTPTLKIVETKQMLPLMNSWDQRGWTTDGNYNSEGSYEQNMGGDHDVTFNLWEDKSDGWVDID